MNPGKLRACAVGCAAVVAGVLGLTVDLATLSAVGMAASISAIALLLRAGGTPADPEDGTDLGPPPDAPADPTPEPSGPATGSGAATPESPGPPGA